MWILFWLLISAIILGASAWSLSILLKQKAAWETYAKQKSFSFSKGTFMGPAEMTGVIGDYKVSFFTAERTTADVRSRRYMTVIEINLADGFVDGGVIGTKEMLPFMQTLDRLHPVPIDFVPWEDGNFAFIRNNEPFKAYFTQERAEAALQILKTRNADVIIIFNDKEVVVRTETSDPMQDAAKIDKIVTRLLSLIDKMRINGAQRAQYMAATQ